MLFHHHIILFTPFYRQADWGSEKCSNLRKVTQLESGRIGRQALGCLTQSPVQGRGICGQFYTRGSLILYSAFGSN